jgi:anti-sigma factor (TIGR02949 family)
MTKQHDHQDCQKYLKQLSEYIDGELDANLCARLEEHLKGCTNCTVVVDTLKRTIELYQTEVIDNDLPLDVKGRLYSRLLLDDLLK